MRRISGTQLIFLTTKRYSASRGSSCVPLPHGRSFKSAVRIGLILLCAVSTSACQNTSPSVTSGSAVSELVLFDRKGTEENRIKDAALLGEIIVLIDSAPNCGRWQWKEADIQKKFSIKYSSGAERRFVLIKPDRLIEVGLAPDQACRQVDFEKLLNKLKHSTTKANEALFSWCDV